MGFSLNGADFTEFSEFRESIEAWAKINLTVFSVSCVCGTVVDSLSFTQEGVGLSTAILFLKWYYFCHWIQQIQWKHLGKTRMCIVCVSVRQVDAAPGEEEDKAPVMTYVKAEARGQGLPSGKTEGRGSVKCTMDTRHLKPYTKLAYPLQRKTKASSWQAWFAQPPLCIVAWADTTQEQNRGFLCVSN